MPISSLEMVLENVAWFVGSKDRMTKERRKMVGIDGFAIFFFGGWTTKFVFSFW